MTIFSKNYASKKVIFEATQCKFLIIESIEKDFSSMYLFVKFYDLKNLLIQEVLSNYLHIIFGN